MINRSLCSSCPKPRHPKVANLSNASAFQSIQPSISLAAAPKIRLPRILSASLGVCFRRKIFIRFFLLRSILIKDSSADSITCFMCRCESATESPAKRHSGKFSQISCFFEEINWIWDEDRRCHCFDIVATEGKEKVPQVFSSVRYIFSLKITTLDRKHRWDGRCTCARQGQM